MQNAKLSRVAAAGTVASFALFTAAAILSKPGFVFLKDFLSELGRSGLAAVLFNGGLVITAMFVAVFFIALAKTEGKQILALLASLAGVVSALSLAGVAAFPIQVEPEHATAAYAFFLSAALAVLLSSLSSLLAKNRNHAFLAALCLLEVTSTIFLALYENALYQVTTIALFGAWMGAKAFAAMED